MTIFDDKCASVFVAGHRGLVGSAILRCLKARGFGNLLTATRSELDLRDQAAVERWFERRRPEYVFLVAGTVGGIVGDGRRPVNRGPAPLPGRPAPGLRGRRASDPRLPTA